MIEGDCRTKIERIGKQGYNNGMNEFHLKHPAKPSFAVLLNQLMIKKNKNAPEVYKAAWMDRRVFSRIANLNELHLPSKTNAIAIALALKCDEKESKMLIKRAGYILTHGLAFDRVILMCIEEKIYDIAIVNQRLETLGLKPINVLR